ncbi:MAG TPA: inositol-3-phosphate synthase [Dehalococcoidia bacterium]|nr:inositol-3-phosphate synthase [Dehalococcoidia bacterium]
MAEPLSINPATGRLGILTPGMGAVATTTYAGVIAARQGLGTPFGSLTQMGRIQLGKGIERSRSLIKACVPLATLDELVFGGWDPFPDNAFEAARKAGVLSAEHLMPLREELEAIQPMPAVFDRSYVRNLGGANVKHGETKMDLARQLMEDMQGFQQRKNCDRLVVVSCGSTEVFAEPAPVHDSLDAFEHGLRNSDPRIAPSQIYAYAALSLGIPFVNGAPNLTVDIPAMLELAQMNGVPVAGKDLKTGQTLMKTVLAPGLKARMLGVRGWFSTNILGNRDGEVLDDPDSFRTKEVSKLGVLESILQPEQYPELYGDIYHKVRINYYPPHGDNKEGWDNIDLFGWLGYPMQVKIDFLCRDSILAAPLVLDLALFMDLAHRAGQRGVQEWLSFYFKSPQVASERSPEHDLFVQQTMLRNTLRRWLGEDPTCHEGDYAEEEEA